MNDSHISEWQRRATNFLAEATSILSKNDSSPHRLVSLETTRQKLTSLSILQNHLFEDSIKCIECGAYRAAHVMAWAAFMDCLEDKLISNRINEVHNQYPNWINYTSKCDFQENVVEYQLIEVAYKVHILSKAEKKTVHGHLSKRNECAHPSSYSPGMNEAIGYVAELLERVESLNKRA